MKARRVLARVIYNYSSHHSIQCLQLWPTNPSACDRTRVWNHEANGVLSVLFGCCEHELIWYSFLGLDILWFAFQDV